MDANVTTPVAQPFRAAPAAVGRPEGLRYGSIVFCVFAAAIVGSGTSHAQTLASAANSCVACHSTQADQRLANPTKLFSGQDVHREKGFDCVDCHGGSPTSSDK